MSSTPKIERAGTSKIGAQAPFFMEQQMSKDPKQTVEYWRAIAERNLKDAERYRWLRHGDNDESCLVLVDETYSTNCVWLLRNEGLDLRIDTKMAYEQKGKVTHVDPRAID